MSIATNIADAVTAELNAAQAGAFSIPFVAARRVHPEFDLPALKNLTVSVVPKSIQIVTQTRSMCYRDVAVDVALQQKLESPKVFDERVSTLGTLVDEITDYLRQRTLSTATYAVWVSISNDPVYAPEHLAENHVFTSVLTVMYRMMS
jgi:hypothetical protein